MILHIFGLGIIIVHGHKVQKYFSFIINIFQNVTYSDENQGYESNFHFDRIKKKNLFPKSEMGSIIKIWNKIYLLKYGVIRDKLKKLSFKVEISSPSFVKTFEFFFKF